MHVCIFPDLKNTAPIYGFDVIAGKNKMTGAFHDFSPSADPDHPMIQGYYESVEHFVPEKQRELPEWAKNIFTGKMLAAGNVKSEEEATEIIRIAVDNLKAYFDEVGETQGEGDPSLRKITIRRRMRIRTRKPGKRSTAKTQGARCRRTRAAYRSATRKRAPNRSLQP